MPDVKPVSSTSIFSTPMVRLMVLRATVSGGGGARLSRPAGLRENNPSGIVTRPSAM